MEQIKVAAVGLMLIAGAGNVAYADTERENVPNTPPVQSAVQDDEATALPPAEGRAEQRVHEGTNRTYLVWSLAQLQNEPVTTADMQLSGVGIGSDAAAAVRAFGAPEAIRRGNMDTEYRWAGGGAVVRDAVDWPAEVAAQYHIPQVKLQQGVISVTATQAGPKTPRGLTVGNSRENVVRMYGAPAQVRLDPATETTYYLYDNPEGTQRLTVTVHKLQVGELRIDAVDAQAHTEKEEDRGERLLGWRVGEVYQEPSWATWESKAEMKERCYWLFRDMMIEVDLPTQKIRKVIVRSPHVATSKGIALGDSVSTLLHVYGKPLLQEQGDGDRPSVWYYTDHADAGAYLAFVISTDKKEVIDIILTDTKLAASADRDVRYGLKSEAKSPQTR